MALLAGDVASTGYFCASNALGDYRNKAALRAEGLVGAVVGCGPVGLAAMLAALDLGAERVYAIDMVKERLELATSLGGVAVHLEDVSNTVPESQLDFVMECVGRPSALELAFKLVKPFGTVSSCGVHADGVPFPFTPAMAYDKNLTYRAGRCPVRSIMEDVLPLLRDGKMAQLERIITHTATLEDAAAMYAQFEAQRDGCVKVVFRL
jgi:threonine dehydrogenase-like Zn-dependent dehydrogenase